MANLPQLALNLSTDLQKTIGSNLGGFSRPPWLHGIRPCGETSKYPGIALIGNDSLRSIPTAWRLGHCLNKHLGLIETCNTAQAPSLPIWKSWKINCCPLISLTLYLSSLLFWFLDFYF